MLNEERKVEGGRVFSNSSLKLVERQEFERNGAVVEEYILELDPPLKHGDTDLTGRLFWVRKPFEEKFVDGKPNAMAGIDFTLGNLASMESARQKVAKEFDRYWVSEEAIPVESGETNG